jgi:hypothetical protein
MLKNVIIFPGADSEGMYPSPPPQNGRGPIADYLFVHMTMVHVFPV